MVGILDVTLREAGAIKGYSFCDQQVLRIIRALDQCGIEAVETGYFRPLLWQTEPDYYCCPPRYLQFIRREVTKAKVVVFVHSCDVQPREYSLLKELGIDLVRLAITPWNIDDLPLHVVVLNELKLPFTLNVVRISQLDNTLLQSFARLSEEWGAVAIYLADSNGSLYPDQLALRISQVASECNTPIGLHLHDHISLAFANMLVAKCMGVKNFDASLCGIGRGGNLRTELIASHLHMRCGHPYNLEMLMEVCEDLGTSPLAKSEWQQIAVDSIAGMLNLNSDEIQKLTNKSLNWRVLLQSYS